MNSATNAGTPSTRGIHSLVVVLIVAFAAAAVYLSWRAYGDYSNNIYFQSSVNDSLPIIGLVVIITGIGGLATVLVRDRKRASKNARSRAEPRQDAT